MAERSEGKSRRGFASMDESRQREIASKGGRAAHAKGTAHEFDSNEARAAGRKGGEARGTSARNGAARGAAARLGGEASRGDSLRGTANEVVRGGAADTYRSTEGRADAGRAASTRLGDHDRTEQLRADEFPADQPRASQNRERSAGGSNNAESRDVGAGR